MPKKFVDTSPRRWGTRFDSLVPASPNIPQTELSSPSAATPQLAHQSVRPVPSGHRDLQKLPHDASVFVGSLPSTVDHRELIRALYDHLSPHTEILSIKVVRDSRHGGVCAFVQCESAESAAQLITTLHANPPPPFFGRTLRYERARSQRALLVSYRAPTVFNSPDPSSGDVHGSGSFRSIDPATAMRLYKTQGERFFSIKYNEGTREHLSGNGTTEDGFLLSPLTFDAEAVRQIVSFFGPVDEIKTYALGATVQPLHTASRLSMMDTSVWEVNFNHRDDALNALMTLRTVPHLTVTWAHQSNSQEQGRLDQQTPIIPPVEDNRDPPTTTLPRAQSDAVLSRHSSGCDDRGTDSVLVNSDAPTRRTSLSEDGFPPLVVKPVSWADDETLPPSDSSRTIKTTSEYESVPPTPGFTSGSVSPTTPLTFSSTPTTPHSAQFTGGFTGGGGSLQYDYTSLFVGGLPPSWEEENVRNVFDRFPGLEEVQLIRPTMKKGSSFAFVRFDNTESPRKAIDAENDRVHDGRRIRVQIRDLNPPGRYAWKRGIQRHLTGGDNNDTFAASDLGYVLHGDSGGGGSVNPPQAYPTIHQDKAGPLEASASVTTTPQPSTPGQQTPFVPYPYHTYYPAAPWSYPHYPYPMHYYHGYPPYGHMQPYPPPTTAVYNPYAVVQPPTPTDLTATSSQPPVPHTPIKPVYNASEHSGFYSDFQSDYQETCIATTPPLGHPPTMAQATPPPPASHPPPVVGHPYPPYNPMQWTQAGPATPHIHTPGVYMHFPPQAQTTPSRQTPTFPMVGSAPHNHQQRDSHRGRRNQRHQQRNTNVTDVNTFASPGHRQGLNHGFDHRNGVQPMPQWVNGGR